MRKIYFVELSTPEREQLLALTRSRETNARRWHRARTLLLADRGRPDGELPDTEIAAALGCCVRTVERTRKRFAEEGLEATSSEAPRPGRAKKLSSKEEALLIATACSEAPDRRDRWTMRLLADRMVELTTHEVVSRELVRRTLKKTP